MTEIEKYKQATVFFPPTYTRMIMGAAGPFSGADTALSGYARPVFTATSINFKAQNCRLAKRGSTNLVPLVSMHHVYVPPLSPPNVIEEISAASRSETQRLYRHSCATDYHAPKVSKLRHFWVHVWRVWQWILEDLNNFITLMVPLRLQKAPTLRFN